METAAAPDAVTSPTLAWSTLLHPRRSSWAPKRALRCNTSGHFEPPLISAIVQTFDDSKNALQLVTRLHKLPRVEVIVNDDSGIGHAEWLRWLTGPNDFIMKSPNIHEIRAYNRLARFARGDYLLLLQGDHCLPQEVAWLEQGMALFKRFPRLGLLGGQMGFDRVPFRRVAENISWGTAPCNPIPYHVRDDRDSAGDSQQDDDTGGIPFMFVAGVNIGPLLVRRSAFLEVSGFDESFSCVGEPGIQLDMELSLQFWRHGYQVGLWYSAVSNGVGGRKTRKNPHQKSVRLRNDVTNGKKCQRLLARHNRQLVKAANTQLAPAREPSLLRGQHLDKLGMLPPRECLAAASVPFSRRGRRHTDDQPT